MNILPVYIANINDFRGEYAKGLTLLTPQRRSKVLRYRHEDDRLRCLCAGLLERRYCGITEDSQLQYLAWGKPVCDGMEYSISHGGDYVVLCLSDRPVGVDIEPLGNVNPKVAKRVFCKDELAWMENDQNKRFFLLWSRKESIMKATGKGFYLSPGSFSVLPFDESPRIIDGGLYSSSSIIYENCALSVTALDRSPHFQIVPAEGLMQ